MACMSKLSKCPIIPGSLAASFILNSNRSHLPRIRFSPRLFAPAWRIGAHGLAWRRISTFLPLILLTEIP